MPSDSMSRPATDAYREAMTWGREQLDRYCPGCGRLPAWCECFVGGLLAGMGATAADVERAVPLSAYSANIDGAKP